MIVFIENDPLFFNEIKYIFSIFCKNKGIKYTLSESKNLADLILSTEENANLRISKEFYLKLNKGQYDHSVHFRNDCKIIDSSGFEDSLSTAFYILSCMQEYKHPREDQFGRFRYVDSFQYKFKNTGTNIVQVIFDQLFDSLHKLNLQVKVKQQSKIFLSHDIDTVNGSLIQDSYFSFKKLRPYHVLKVLFSNIFVGPLWLNMDKIMKIESEHDFYSTFYWLVNKGKVTTDLNNSDYDIKNRRIQNYIKNIEGSKWENGLHKSASNDSFKVEQEKLGIDVKGNRYHYLRFKPYSDFHKIEEASLLFDSSIGFAEEFGFRNGYGLPYSPYSISERRPFNFVECPLNIMDTTFFKYKNVSSSELVRSTIDFCESNKYDCVLSVLFHNNYLSDYKYKNYFKAFRELLEYFHESGFKCITQTEIINQYLDEH